MTEIVKPTDEPQTSAVHPDSQHADLLRVRTHARRRERSGFSRRHVLGRQRQVLRLPAGCRLTGATLFARPIRARRLQRDLDRWCRARPASAAPHSQTAWPLPADTSVDELDPADTWVVVEDMWTRLSAVCQTTVALQGGSFELRFANLRDCDGDDVPALIAQATDVQSYRWHLPGQHGDFVQAVALIGDDLIIRTATLRAMQAWPAAADIPWQVEGLLLRLQRRCSS